ncbi:MAG: HAMP domain-containing protein [Acidobacteria bacterium]|nr:HAMP domain-containing protein [Acidobacteriota bacterium]
MSGSLKNRLLLYILPSSLIPLVFISAFSYFRAQKRITEDRITLYLEQIAQDTADKIDLTLLEKREEVLAMELNDIFAEVLEDRRQETARAQALLNQMVLLHQVYDLILVFDTEGNMRLCNTRSRQGGFFAQGQLGALLAMQPSASEEWFETAAEGNVGYLDWHRSPFVKAVYDYSRQDVMNQYQIGFAVPVRSRRTQRTVGVLVTLINWQCIQEILDQVEKDFGVRQLKSGYAFLFKNDHNTIIGHKYRRNRSLPEVDAPESTQDNYGTRLVEEHHLQNLANAVVQAEKHYSYEYPPGTRKISGLAGLNYFFGWTCGVGIDHSDIFAPVNEMRTVLLVATVLSAGLVVFLVYGISRGITVPLKKLTSTAAVISAGDFSGRVDVRTGDELQDLARTFNEMAQSLQERSHALLELNRNLEHKVRERTVALQQSNAELKAAYQDLQQAHAQLVQSEKMASLGQLVAGIAHEIKNPLNFIYGNTDFLRDYIGKLKNLVDRCQSLASLSAEDRQRLDREKQTINFDFLMEDLSSLIDNFEEGAGRIHAIVADLRTFSRMDTHEVSDTDVEASIDVALNLLKNMHRERIRIHRQYTGVPRIRAYAGQLGQVFMNILSNACQAIPAQGDIWIRTHTRDGKVAVEFEDNGRGIPQEHLHRIFEPFFTTKKTGEGTGLGLSISYGIIRQHNGQITVQSEPGKGTRFQVVLPVGMEPQGGQV